MTTAVADPPVVAAAAPAAAVATPSPAPAAAPAGVGAGSGAGGAPAPAPGATPAAEAPKRRSLLDGAADPAPAPAADPAAKVEQAKTEAAKVDDPAAWKLEAPKDTAVDAADLTAVETFAKEKGFSKEQAQALLQRDLAAKAEQTKAQQAMVDGLADRYATEVEKHPTFGGANLPQTIENAKRALVALTSPEERKQIVASPLGNHPLLISILNRAAALMREDRAVVANAAPAAQVDGMAAAAQALYGSRAKLR